MKLKSQRHRQTRLNPLAHGDVFGELVEFLAIGGALRFFGGEGLDAPDVSAELCSNSSTRADKAMSASESGSLTSCGSVMSTRWPLR